MSAESPTSSPSVADEYLLVIRDENLVIVGSGMAVDAHLRRMRDVSGGVGGDAALTADHIGRVIAAVPDNLRMVQHARGRWVTMSEAGREALRSAGAVPSADGPFVCTTEATGQTWQTRTLVNADATRLDAAVLDIALSNVLKQVDRTAEVIRPKATALLHAVEATEAGDVIGRLARLRQAVTEAPSGQRSTSWDNLESLGEGLQSALVKLRSHTQQMIDGIDPETSLSDRIQQVNALVEDDRLADCLRLLTVVEGTALLWHSLALRNATTIGELEKSTTAAGAALEDCTTADRELWTDACDRVDAAGHVDPLDRLRVRNIETFRRSVTEVHTVLEEFGAQRNLRRVQWSAPEDHSLGDTAHAVGDKLTGALNEGLTQGRRGIRDVAGRARRALRGGPEDPGSHTVSSSDDDEVEDLRLPGAELTPRSELALQLLQIQMMEYDRAHDPAAEVKADKESQILNATDATIRQYCETEPAIAGEALTRVQDVYTAPAILRASKIAELAPLAAADLHKRSEAIVVLAELMTFEPWSEGLSWARGNRETALQIASESLTSLHSGDLDTMTREFDAIRGSLRRRSINWGQLAVGALFGGVFGLAVAGAGQIRSSTNVAAIQAVKVDLIAKMVAADAEDSDEVQRRVVEAMQERINTVVNQQGALVNRINDLKSQRDSEARRNVDLEQQIAMLNDRLDRSRTTVTVLEVVRDRAPIGAGDE